MEYSTFCSTLTQDFTLIDKIGFVIIVATLFAAVPHRFKHPLIPMYIIAGFVIGPMLGCITDQDVLKDVAELGIAFSLFVVGIELDINRLRKVGNFPVIAAFVQSVILFFVGYILVRALMPGFNQMDAVYIGVALMFSSTMLIIKLLSDKNELDTLHGRILLGILLVEDIIAVFVLSLLGTTGGITIPNIASSFIKGFGLFSIAIVASRFIFPPVLHYAEKSRELLFIVALSICFLFIGLSESIGYSPAIGAFVAGVSIASFPFNLEISHKVRSLRDFFATIFFVSLGMQIHFVTSVILPAAIFAFLALFLKPVISFVLSSFWGYGKKVSFFTAVGLTQVSEFSLIIAFAGYYSFDPPHISPEVFSLITIFTAITLTVSPYMIRFENEIYKLMSRWLTIFEQISPRMKKLDEERPTAMSKHTIVCGGGSVGMGIVRRLQREGKDFVIIDYNPDVVASLAERKIPAIYGDVNDTEVLEKAGYKSADIIVSTIEEYEYGSNLYMVTRIKSTNPKSVLIMTTSNVDYAVDLYNEGADYVVLPKILSGERTASIVGTVIEKPQEFEEIKVQHMRSVQALEERIAAEKRGMIHTISITELDGHEQLPKRTPLEKRGVHRKPARIMKKKRSLRLMRSK